MTWGDRVAFEWGLWLGIGVCVYTCVCVCVYVSVCVCKPVLFGLLLFPSFAIIVCVSYVFSSVPYSSTFSSAVNTWLYTKIPQCIIADCLLKCVPPTPTLIYKSHYFYDSCYLVPQGMLGKHSSIPLIFQNDLNLNYEGRFLFCCMWACVYCSLT
jgi:hypothetical protein